MTTDDGHGVAGPDDEDLKVGLARLEAASRRRWRSVVAAAAQGTIDELLSLLVGLLEFSAPEGLGFQLHTSDLDLGELGNRPPVEGWVFPADQEYGHAVLGFDEEATRAIAWFWPLEITPDISEFRDERFSLAITDSWVVVELRDAALRGEVLERVEIKFRGNQQALRFDSWLMTVRSAAQEAARKRPELITSMPETWRALWPTELQDRVLVCVAAIHAKPAPGNVGALAQALLNAGSPQIRRRSTPASLTAAARFGHAAELWVDDRLRTIGDASSAERRTTVLRLPGTGRSVDLRHPASTDLISELAYWEPSLVGLLGGR